jgi:hypothetical protein
MEFSLFVFDGSVNSNSNNKRKSDANVAPESDIVAIIVSSNEMFSNKLFNKAKYLTTKGLLLAT